MTESAKDDDRADQSPVVEFEQEIIAGEPLKRSFF
jgi:hypothetical protein